MIKTEKARISSSEGVMILRGNSKRKSRFSLSLREQQWKAA